MMLAISLLLLAVVAVGVGLGLRRLLTGGGGVGGDGGAVRRFFQYLLLYGLLVVVAVGLSGLLARFLGGADIVRFDQAQLARSLTFLLVGGTIYAGVALWSRRRLAEDPAEARSLGWAFYTTLGSLTGLVAAMASLHSVLSWAVGRAEYDGGEVAGLMVWGVVWAVHWLLDRRITPPRRSRLHHLVGSLIGLGTSFAGWVGLLAGALDILFGTARGVMVQGEVGLWGWAVTAAVGLPVWWVYWVGTSAGAERSPLWLAYVFLFGVGGGLVSVLSAAAAALFRLLVWVIGEPSSDDPWRHFGDFPDWVATIAVGMAVWWYHRSLLSEPADLRSEVRRVYEYLMAGIGLVAASLGVATLLVAFLEAISGTEDVVVAASAVNTLLAACTALVVGSPLWWVFWRRIQASDPEEERASPTRRVYLFLLFGVGGVAAVIALITAVFVFVEDALEGALGAETVRSTRFAVGVLAATGAVAAYHWAVYRSDRRQAPEQPEGPSYVLLIGPSDDEIARRVARRTGGRVQVWARTDGGGGGWAVEQVMDALGESTEEEVVVVSDREGLHVIPVVRS